MTHNNNCLFTSKTSTVTKPKVQNARAFYLQAKSILIITVQVPAELKPQYIYQLRTSDNLSLGIIPLAVDHKISHNYPNLLNILIWHTAEFISQDQLYWNVETS